MTWTLEKQREYMRDYYRENRERWLKSRSKETPERKAARLEKARVYSRTHKERLRSRKVNNAEHIKHVQYVGRNLKKYGITGEDFDALLVAQEGCCAICQKRMVKPVIDHCHKTGCVRALLCAQCNTAIGLFKEDRSNMRAAIAYLETWECQAAMLKARAAVAKNGGGGQQQVEQQPQEGQ